MVLDNLSDLEDEIEDTAIDIGGRKVALEDVERAYGSLAQAKDIVSVVTPSADPIRIDNQRIKEELLC